MDVRIPCLHDQNVYWEILIEIKERKSYDDKFLYQLYVIYSFLNFLLVILVHYFNLLSIALKEMAYTPALSSSDF